MRRGLRPALLGPGSRCQIFVTGIDIDVGIGIVVGIVLVMMMMRGPTPSCSPGGLLSNRSPLVFLDRWYPCFTNFDSIILVDVIREKSHVNSFLDSSGVPV